MGRYNKGTVFTNDNCIACNKCVAECQNLGANISVLKGDINSIQVDAKKCTDCGVCIRACKHSAREYRDDTDAFFASLAEGEKLSLIVSTSFYALYPKEASAILGYLKDLGVEKIYDMAYGSEISVWSQCRYLKSKESLNDEEKAFISPSCSALVNEVEQYHPTLLRKLIPVHSPMMCTAIYVNRYLGDPNRLVFLGPCIAASDEIKAVGEPYNLEMNVTFKHLMEYIKGKNIEGFRADSDLKARCVGNIIPLIGGLKEIVSAMFDREGRFDSYWNFGRDIFGMLELSSLSKGNRIQPLFAEVFACGSGCQEGPGIERTKYNIEGVYRECISIRSDCVKQYCKNASPAENWKWFDALFEDLDERDFGRTFTDKYRQAFHIPGNAYDEIYQTMLKDTPEKRAINCGSCGYQTCHEMATAIAYGYNRKENCIHYMNDRMRQQYMYSSVAGLFNEDVFVEKVQKLISKNPDKRYSIVNCDITKLKLINDICGFETGEKVLNRIGLEIRKYIGEDGLAGYLGGGSFVIIREYDEEKLKAMEQLPPFDFSDIGVNSRVTVHMGYYVIEDAAENVRTAINYAAMASKLAESTIHNTICSFSAKTRDDMRLETEISSQMLSAIDNNEFVLWFQPQYSTVDNSIVGAEALCRWIKPDGTMVYPGVFIPISEKNGFIGTLDRMIWRMAFATVRQWIDSGIEPPPLSVNISTKSLERDDIVNYIAGLRDEYKISNRYIHFEITEGTYFGSREMMTTNINKLRRLGYRIAMDDFGSGYSSLNTLKDMPIDILKIDMGFMRDDKKTNRGGAIISAISRMAQDLELTLIAEGVEQQNQVDFLSSIGVTTVQGYLYAKPMPNRDYVELIANRQETKLKRTRRKDIHTRLDVGRFFDPSSYESLMFETFTGPAAILEYNEITGQAAIVRFNKSGLEMIGSESKSFLEVQKLFEKFAVSENQGLREHLSETVSTDSVITVTFSIHEQKHLNEIWIRATLRTISSVENRYLVFVILEDITDERLVENMLELSNAQTAYLMDAGTVGLCLMHVKSDVTKVMETTCIKILKINKEMAEIWGYSEEEVMNWNEKEVMKLIHPLDRPKFLAELSGSINERGLVHHTTECRIQFKNGYFNKVSVVLTAITMQDKSFMVSMSVFEAKEKGK